MRELWLGVALAMAMGFGAGAAAAQGEPDPAVAVAERFIGLLQAGDWAGAGGMLSPSIPPEQLGAAQLERVWGQLHAGLGELGSVTLHRVTPAMDTLKVVELLAGFARQPMLLRVAVGPDGSVAGFFVVPVPSEAPPPEPVAAPPYAQPERFNEEEVVVGAAPWQLPGTLTLPTGAGRHPAVVLVHGSGPHDRDATIGGARVFRDLAWGLASQGITVLRYEKRTRVHGAQMRGAVTLDDEVIADALAALELLRSHPSVDPARVYVLGHSLGAMLAPAIARRDGALAGAILLAATARPMSAVLRGQFEYLLTLPDNAAPAAQADLENARAQVERLIAGAVADDETVLGAPASYFRELMAVDPVATALELSIPLLVLHGERDYQVTMEDHRIWAEATKARPATTVHAFPALNHLFVAGSGQPRPAEYALPGHVSAAVVEMIGQWVLR